MKTWMLTVLMLWVIVVPSLGSDGDESKEYVFDKDTDYSVCYRLNDWNVTRIDKASVQGVSAVGEKQFLVLNRKNNFSNYGNELINLDQIIAMMPSQQAFLLGSHFCKPVNAGSGRKRPSADR